MHFLSFQKCLEIPNLLKSLIIQSPIKVHDLMSTKHAYDRYFAYNFTKVVDTWNLSMDLFESRWRDVYETTNQVYKIIMNDKHEEM